MIAHPLVRVAYQAAAETPILYQGVRKIINGMTWELPWAKPERMNICHKEKYDIEPMAVIDFPQLGYGSNKFKQLVRNYVNEEEFARVRNVLDKRRRQTFTSVAVSLRGGKKDARSMGWCMLSLVVTRAKGVERVEVQYRSTELTLKFGGDLAFLPWIFDQLGLNPELVTFRFANCFISGVYLPYLSTFVKDPVPMLHHIGKLDPQFFASGTRFFLRSAYKKDQVFPYSPENVAHKFGWAHLGKSTMTRIRDYLEERHKAYGKPLPTTHYKVGEYIPRGQRGEEE